MRLLQALRLARTAAIPAEHESDVLEAAKSFLRANVGLSDWEGMSDHERRIMGQAGEAIWAERAYRFAVALGADDLHASSLLIGVDGGAAYAQAFLEAKVAAYEAKISGR